MSLNGNLNKSQFMEELQQKVEHINNVLEKFLPAEEGQQRIIFEAMNYSVRAGGKRLRPILMEETYHMFGGSSAVIEPYKGACTLVEVKAATGNIKSTKTILNHPEKYHVSSAIKLGDYNVGRMGQVLTLPLYMAFLLRTL